MPMKAVVQAILYQLGVQVQIALQTERETLFRSLLDDRITKEF
jgi:hypothetical protein